MTCTNCFNVKKKLCISSTACRLRITIISLNSINLLVFVMGKQCFILVGIKSDILIRGISYFKSLTDYVIGHYAGCAAGE